MDRSLDHLPPLKQKELARVGIPQGQTTVSAIVPEGVDVERALDELVAKYGRPEFSRCDNGGQFIAFVVQRWATRRGVRMAYIDPGKPWQNGAAESLVATYRREVLDAELFHSLVEAQVITERWRRKYNEERPHSRLKYRPPATAYPFNKVA